MFCGYVPGLNLEQLVHFPKRVTYSTGNTLDLILTSNPAVFDVVTALDAVTDHTVISSSMRLSTCVSRTPQKRILLYNKANLKEINLELTTCAAA